MSHHIAHLARLQRALAGGPKARKGGRKHDQVAGTQAAWHCAVPGIISGPLCNKQAEVALWMHSVAVPVSAAAPYTFSFPPARGGVQHTMPRWNGPA